MRKYFQVIKNTLQEYFIYRLNFMMWRFRTVIRLLATYFLWLAIFRNRQEVGGYSLQLILTYILGTSVIWAITMASRSVDIGGEIAGGNLSNYLLKPISYFRYWFSRDLADKFLNTGFVTFEMALIIWLFRPPIFWQTNIFYLATFFLVTILAMLLYFYLSFIISLTTFWYVEHSGWPARFLFEVTLGFLAGGLFPLDILPPAIYGFFKLLPSTYLLFFPLQVYLGRVNSSQIVFAILVMMLWLIILNFAIKFVWQKGLRAYEAYGQ